MSCAEAWRRNSGVWRPGHKLGLSFLSSFFLSAIEEDAVVVEEAAAVGECRSAAVCRWNKHPKVAL